MMARLFAKQVVRTDGKLFWEDFPVGQVMDFGCCELSREDIIDFARQFDPQPFHIDEQAARSTIFEGLAASGWHVCVTYMAMFQEHLLSRCQRAGLYGIEEIKWRIPVRPGDELSCRVTCVERNVSVGRKGFGICTLFCEGLNACGQTVMSLRLQLELQLQSMCHVGLIDAGACVPNKRHGSNVTRLPRQHAITFFEDVQLGTEISLGGFRFAEESVVSFNERYGPHPMHPDASENRLCVSGWHVTSIWMQRLISYYKSEAERLRLSGDRAPELGPSPGIKHLRWHRPVYAGDSLIFSSWAERKFGVQSRPDWGLLLSGTDVRNQSGKCVVSFYALLLLERRVRA
ncbi:MAG: MaoC/PaaZ C-terminal domain-containing protein [Hyphomicrobiaceae bacterium]